MSRDLFIRLYGVAEYLLLMLIMLLITLGMIPLGIPLIWIAPWVTLAYAMLYFKLFGAESQTLAD